MYNQEIYSTLFKTQSYFLIQVSGQKAHEYFDLKTHLNKNNLRIIKPSSQTLRPLLPEYLAPMCVGPLSMIYGQNPNIKVVVDVCAKSGGKMSLLGGSVDGVCLSRDGLVEFMMMPSLDEMRGELIGVLEVRSRELIEILGQHQNELLSVLERRE